jgi:tetratricopeptide (TPR) repeat protein
LQAAALGMLAVLLYVPAVSNGFVNWDDDRLLFDNPAVTRPDGLRRIWSAVELPDGFPNYPLTLTSYWLEYRLWGPDPRGYHAVNVALHGINTALVFALLCALGARAWTSAVAAALFAVHPMQVESVAWVAERKNVLAAAFALGACLAYVRSRATGNAAAYGVALVLFAAALLSKTAVVVVPLSLLLFERLRDGRCTRGVLWRIAPMLALSAVAALLTMLVEPTSVHVPLADRPLLAAAAAWFYAGKLLLPVALLPVYPRWELAPLDPTWWLPLLGLGGAALLLWRWPLPWRAGWGVGHFVCLLLPVLGLVSFGFSEYSFVADRHVYLASIGVFLVAALGLERLRARAPSAVTLLALVLIATLALLSQRQIGVWRDAVSLWSYELVYRPDFWAAQNNLALALIDRGETDAASALLEAARAARPADAEVRNNLALVAYRRGDFDAAVRFSREAVALRGGEAGFEKNLGLALAAGGDITAAEVHLRRAVALAPEAPDLRLLLADALLRQGRLTAAISELEAVVVRAPETAEAHSQLGRALLASGRPLEAAAALNRAVALRPDAAELRYNLALALQHLGRNGDAARELERAVAQRPDFAAAHDLRARLAREGAR